ncbi:hypothetical protein DERP_003475 [Dermatophagoides pteronyssinus]|uniref:Uncharacterized protein n=1 Tax=Dermatophagoides pteronyssinus TaxID=6956 RepID=A0ABQ8JLA5_DERPT|nr:hypothetical protein DERP_003475 [Dermatophagoides pteronyssinus]
MDSVCKNKNNNIANAYNDDNNIERFIVPNRPLNDIINDKNCANICNNSIGTNIIAIIIVLIIDINSLVLLQVPQDKYGYDFEFEFR